MRGKLGYIMPDQYVEQYTGLPSPYPVDYFGGYDPGGSSGYGDDVADALEFPGTVKTDPVAVETVYPVSDSGSSPVLQTVTTVEPIKPVPVLEPIDAVIPTTVPVIPAGSVPVVEESETDSGFPVGLVLVAALFLLLAAKKKKKNKR